MLETKCVDGKYKMLVTVLAILQTSTIFLHYRRVQTLKVSHQHSQIVDMFINITVTELALSTNCTVSMIMTYPQKTMKSALLVCFFCVVFAWAAKISLLLDI